MELGNGFWIKIEAVRVDPTPDRPHGLRYSLCLFAPGDERVVCFDNAHPVRVGSGPATRTTGANDHVHKGRRIRPYGYTNAEALMKDFWTAVDEHLRKEGVP
ncbi:MAG: hypothetical protein HY059_08230 [Proteobacteria bacterium]|nr:hypothetical protein [Pseudomonadota bacterium]